ncbi:TonB-dependent receptor [Flavobacterium sp. CYK-55]|uniref:TonB-dependent receptor n=1 Tax=Flavobacterium sp. CYK-55 TaxID=2835529 RepID=UPI001BCAF881|nr:TonB-dependent receptor [Flavobacterium sp. CYK-55]MBS7787126.1 TonB-dependent receptor [Flavobacterium sp. CYK-55]
MKSKLVFTLLFIGLLTFAQNKGTITGTLTDKDANNAPLPFANALIKGTQIGTTTNEKGVYTLPVAPGNYTLVFSFLGYENVEATVNVEAGQTVTVNRALGSGSYKLQDVVVKASGGREKETATMLDQKKAVEIKQSIGAQEMARKGVSDVEEGLTKITGITKVGSRGLFVRGLEDRYNNLLINDLAAPTNNPFKKIVPLDLFPTDIVSVIEVFKTFNPNIYGDFAGGTFNIATSATGKSQTKISFGVGYTTDNNLSRFLMADDTNTTKGFFGLIGSDRQLPSAFGTIPSNASLSSEDSKNKVKNGWNVNDRFSPLNTSVGIMHSEKFDFSNNKKLSYLFSLNFDNAYKVRQGVNNTINANGEFNNHLQARESAYKTNVSSLLAMEFKTNRWKFWGNTMFLRSTESLILDQTGIFDGNTASYILKRTNQLEVSDYLNGQIFAQYNLTEDKNQTIKAGGSFAKTSYQQPDRKFFSAAPRGDGTGIINYGGNNFIKQYLDITGNFFYAHLLEYNLKFGSGDEKKNRLTVGYNGNGNNAKTSYRFVFIRENQPSQGAFSVPVNSLDSYLNDDFTLNNIYYAEGSNASYKTKLNEFTNAGYANLLLNFGAFEINGGLRFEKYSREIKYRYNGAFTDPYSKKTIDKNYILPSVNVKYALNEKSNLRLAVSKTYTKPVLMEALPITIINADNTSQQGNPFAVNSDNLNADLKYELFPTSKEMFAVGVFGKKIDNPIERTYKADAGGQITTFLNSDNATLYGVELEWGVELSRLSQSLSAFSWGFNTSIMQTKVNVADKTVNPDGMTSTSIETHKSRELQGASKWLINSDLKYQFNFRKDWSNTLTLVYSVFGKRIYSVGTANLDHIYELPVSRLDLVWGSKIGEHWNLKFSADNLLNPKEYYQLGDNNKTTIYADSRYVQDYKRGVGFSMSVGYTF